MMKSFILNRRIIYHINFDAHWPSLRTHVLGRALPRALGPRDRLNALCGEKDPIGPTEGIRVDDENKHFLREDLPSDVMLHDE